MTCQKRNSKDCVIKAGKIRSDWSYGISVDSVSQGSWPGSKRQARPRCGRSRHGIFEVMVRDGHIASESLAWQRMPAICVTAALAFLAMAAVASSETERSSLFEMNQGDVLEDSGVFTVFSKSATRVEVFETVRHSDGGWTTTSIITDRGRPYRVEGRWSYDPEGHSIEAHGLGAYDGTPARVAITVERPTATIQVDMGDDTRAVSASCGSTCFVDLSPSVMAMFSITRQFDANSTEPRSFQWIGQALHVDRTLLEGGSSDVRLHSVYQNDNLKILQFVFRETLPGDEDTGATKASFNLYVDSDRRPLAFAGRGGTKGSRAGYEFVTERFPPFFDD